MKSVYGCEKNYLNVFGIDLKDKTETTEDMIHENLPRDNFGLTDEMNNHMAATRRSLDSFSNESGGLLGYACL